MSKVCRRADIPVGCMNAFLVGSEDVLIANVAGTFYAVQATCPHGYGRLSRGRLQGKVLTCPIHYAQYDVTTGKVIRDIVPAVMKIVIGHTKDLRTFNVRVEGEDIILGTCPGDKRLADDRDR